MLPILAQSSPNSDPDDSTEESTTDLRPLAQSDSVLSFEGAQRLMTESSAAINAGNYAQATEKLQQARRIFNQLSNYYLKLATIFAGIDPKIVESQRANALKTGQMRDEATYQLALVHRAQNQPELAVPLLIQVIESQNPSSELGKKSYQQLYELGFVDSPLGGSDEPAASGSASPSARN
jgi:tetratricopeptide (TPR) repeat protein